MGKARLEAFSDGVIAILITVMVLELKVPHGDSFEALAEILPVFLSYVLSFVYLGIYWTNHHHLLHAIHKVTGGILWANLHLLFWLSLVPFTTAWMGENHFASVPTALYGVSLLMPALAWLVLQALILESEGPHSPLRAAIGRDAKGKVSGALYFIAVVAAFWHPSISWAIYALVAMMWLVPDRRIERMLHSHETPK